MTGRTDDDMASKIISVNQFNTDADMNQSEIMKDFNENVAY